MSDPAQDKVIIVIGNNYSYSFSRGLLAHSLEARGLSLEEAYELARHVYLLLLREGITEIEENDLRRFVRNEALKRVGKEIAYQYNLIEKWRIRNFPIIILISGAKGTETDTIARILAEKLAIPRIASTSTVTEIMRKLMSNDLSPELHEKSYLAWEKLRPMYSVLYDKILIGFEEHAKYPVEAVEALVKRAILEGVSIVIQGEHLVPRFLSKDILKSKNVIYITISMKNLEDHQSRYLSKYKKSRHEKKKEHFKAIRKIHDYLIEETKQRDLMVVENTTINKAVEKIYEETLNRLAQIIENKTYSEYADSKVEVIHS